MIRVASVVMLSFVLAGVARAWQAPANAADDKTSPSKPSTLDDELLRDLGGQKPSSPAPQKPDGPAERVPAKLVKPGSPLDEELLRDLGGPQPKRAEPGSAGGDSDNPFVRINERMRQVESRLREAQSDAETREIQEQIVRELDELIRKIAEQQQQQQQQSSSSSSPAGTRDRALDQPDSKPGSQQQPTGQNAASQGTESTDRLTEKKEEKPKPRSAVEAWKELWGHLPPRLREQMMQSSNERFLPKYEVLIEEYFKSLAEQPRR